MHQMGTEVIPTHIRFERRHTGLLVQIGADLIEAADTGVASADDVQGGQVERQAQQVVAQGVGDPLVDQVAHLIRHADGDLA